MKLYIIIRAYSYRGSPYLSYVPWLIEGKTEMDALYNFSRLQSPNDVDETKEIRIIAVEDIPKIEKWASVTPV